MLEAHYKKPCVRKKTCAANPSAEVRGSVFLFLRPTKTLYIVPNPDIPCRQSSREPSLMDMQDGCGRTVSSAAVSRKNSRKNSSVSRILGVDNIVTRVQNQPLAAEAREFGVLRRSRDYPDLLQRLVGISLYLISFFHRLSPVLSAFRSVVVVCCLSLSCVLFSFPPLFSSSRLPPPLGAIGGGAPTGPAETTDRSGLAGCLFQVRSTLPPWPGRCPRFPPPGNRNIVAMSPLHSTPVVSSSSSSSSSSCCSSSK